VKEQDEYNAQHVLLALIAAYPEYEEEARACISDLRKQNVPFAEIERKAWAQMERTHSKVEALRVQRKEEVECRRDPRVRAAAGGWMAPKTGVEAALMRAVDEADATEARAKIAEEEARILEAVADATADGSEKKKQSRLPRLVAHITDGCSPQ
jgi:hypothetical protein